MEIQFEVSCKMSAKDFGEKCNLGNLSYFEIELTYNTDYNYSNVGCKLTNENLKDAIHSIIKDNHGSESGEIASIVSAGIFGNEILFSVALEFNFGSPYLSLDIDILQVLIYQYEGKVEKMNVKQNATMKIKEAYKITFDISPLDSSFNDVLYLMERHEAIITDAKQGECITVSPHNISYITITIIPFKMKEEFINKLVEILSIKNPHITVD